MKDYLLSSIILPQESSWPEEDKANSCRKSTFNHLFTFQTLFVPDKRLEANTSAEEPSSLLPVTKPPQPLLTKVFNMHYVLSINLLLY